MARVRLTEQSQNELDAIIEYFERVGASDFAEVLRGEGNRENSSS